MQIKNHRNLRKDILTTRSSVHSIRHTAVNWITNCLIVEYESSAPIVHMMQKYLMASEVK
jgi:hypothetical protein